MNIKEKLSIQAKDLKNELTAIYYAYQNPRIEVSSKIVIVMALAYALSPVDLIPDFIPVIDI